MSMKSMVITMASEHHSGLTPSPGLPAVREKYIRGAHNASHGLVLLTYLQKPAKQALFPHIQPMRCIMSSSHVVSLGSREPRGWGETTMVLICHGYDH